MSQPENEVTQFTTISVPVHVKENLDNHRQDRPWGSFLEQLATDGVDAGVSGDEFREAVNAAVGDASGLEYEDVVSACESAVRNVLESR